MFYHYLSPTISHSDFKFDKKIILSQEMLIGAILSVIMAITFGNLITPSLLPYGPASYIPRKVYPKFTQLDLKNDRLRSSSGKLEKIIERIPHDDLTYEPLVMGPETVLFDEDGVLYILSEFSKLVSLTDFERDPKDAKSNVMTARATEVAYLGGGRPLGGRLVSNPDGISQTLYAADAIYGLIRVQNIPRVGASAEERKQMKEHIVEIVAKRVKMEDGSFSEIRFADDIDIGPQTGHIYFTDASDITSERVGRKWGTMAASKLDLFRGARNGRLLRYKPESGEVDVLANGIWFANGIGVDKDEKFIVVSETFAARYLKYHIQGPKQGELEVVLNEMIGLPDGADCSHTTGLCYAAIVSSPPPILKLLFSLPPVVNRFVRTLFMMTPPSLQPKPVHYGCFIELFPGDENNPPKITRVVQDLHGEDLRLITGVTEYGGKLYLGSLENDVVGVYDLKA